MSEDMQSMEKRLKEYVGKFSYPATPEFARLQQFPDKPRLGFPKRRRAWLAALVMVLLASLLAVPSVRARLFEFLQIGGVQVVLPEASQESSMLTTATPRVDGEFVEDRDTLEDFEGESSLEEAQSALGFRIPLPEYPDGIGAPDKVFLGDFGTGEFAVLYWPADGENLSSDMLLYVIGPDTFLTKAPPQVIADVEVNGQQAVLASGNYLLFATEGAGDAREVEGPVLIWEDGELSYRLEVDLPLEEMIQIAESLQK